MKIIKDKYGNEIELEKVNIDFNNVGIDDETDEFDEVLVEGDIESLKDYVKEVFHNGGRFVGKHKYSSYFGNKEVDFDLKYSTKKLLEVLQTAQARNILPKIENGKLFLPMEDLGGGIITHMELEYKGELND